MVSRIDRARAPRQSRGGGVPPARRPAALPPPPPRVPVNRARDRSTPPPLQPPPPLPPSPKAPFRGERRRRHCCTGLGGRPPYRGRLGWADGRPDGRAGNARTDSSPPRREKGVAAAAGTPSDKTTPPASSCRVRSRRFSRSQRERPSAPSENFVQAKTSQQQQSCSSRLAMAAAAAAAATRSPAGRIIVVVPHYPHVELFRRRRDAFFKAAFSSGLETKERIGTECQRPAVLGLIMRFSTRRQPVGLDGDQIVRTILMICSFRDDDLCAAAVSRDESTSRARETPPTDTFKYMVHSLLSKSNGSPCTEVAKIAYAFPPPFFFLESRRFVSREQWVKSSPVSLGAHHCRTVGQ
ncbi:hypothetical protein QTP88_016869 [Uroleucon formosanum]